MPIANFEQLCTHVCEIAGVPAPELSEDQEGITAFTVRIDEALVSVMQHRELQRSVVIAGVLGTVPDEDQDRACRLLIEANYLSIGRPQMQTASRNPVTGEFVLHVAQSLDDTSGAAVYESITRMAALASQWRATIA
jgi:hypothetical protein